MQILKSGPSRSSDTSRIDTEPNGNIFSDEQLKNISAFISLLRSIRNRLLKEGVDIDLLEKQLRIENKIDK